jgi:signal transduction histidine kinase
LDGVVTRQIFQLQTALERSNRDLERRVHERTAELQNALDRVRELNQLKSDFISNVSHELRMPLQYILGYLGVLDSESLGPLTEQQAKAVEMLLGASQRLKQLIEDLLEFSASTSSNLPVDLVPTLLPGRVQEMVQQALPKAKMRDVFLRTQIATDIPPVQADGERISWVVGQLLDNAVKFTPSGGQVEIDTNLENESVTLSVRDTGIGIPSERIPEIFEPFHQLDGASTRYHQGMGLGLALAQSIIEAHGSSITVNSQVGRGSCFAFSLPYWPS